MTDVAAVSLHHPIALITGASAGIGREFARALVERGYDVILVARRRDRLDELAARLRAEHAGVRVEIIVADLSDPASTEQIAREVAAFGLQVDLLVNNAGFGTHGRFETLPPERERGEIAVNIAALVALTHVFLPGMLKRGSGGVINVASTAAFAPVPYMAVYGGTKAFVRSFSEALHEEVRSRGVRVHALCPGPTATEFFTQNDVTVRGPIRTARDVVATGLRAYDAGAPVVIDGTSNRILIALANVIPRTWATRVAARLMHPGKET